MAVWRQADALRNAMADAIKTRVDAGATAGTIKLYDGTQPADADDAITTQTLLATLTFADPSAPGASSGVLTFDSIVEDSSADATGTAAWARIEDSDGNNVFDVDVTATGGGGTIEINTVSIVAGAAVRATSFIVTIPTG